MNEVGVWCGDNDRDQDEKCLCYSCAEQLSEDTKD